MLYPRVTEIPSARHHHPLMPALTPADQDPMNLQLQDARHTASAALLHQRAAGQALEQAGAQVKAITAHATAAAAGVRQPARRSRRRTS